MNNFDNDNSIQLKAAQEVGIPKKFLNGENKNTIPEIISLFKAGKTLFELYSIFDKIFPEDLAILYSKANSSDKNLLKNINDFYSALKIDKISDDTELRLLIQQWDENFKKLFEEESKEYEKILIIQELLAEYAPLSRSPIKIESAILFSEMEFKNKNIPSSEDGYEIFDLSVPNKTLPYIKWRTNMVDIENKELIKIYKGETEEEMPDFSKILGISNLKESLNTFYFNVFKGENENIITKESFIKSNYNLENNLLKIKIPIDENGNIAEKNKILKRITDVFPLNIKQIHEKSISGETYIFNINVNLLLLSHMVLNDELFRNYLFVKEMSNTSTTSTKNTLKLFFRSSDTINGNKGQEDINSSVSFYINQITAKGGEKFIIYDDNNKVEEIKLSPNSGYLQIKITSADSLEIANSFLKIFTRLLNRYLDEEKKIEKIYLSYIPELLDYKTTEIVKKIGKDADTKISKLKQTAPDLFIADYARKCLCQYQPIPIPDDEIQAWENKKIVYRGKQRKREVLKFPPNNPKWNFVCPDDKYPFPGVKANKLSNRDSYPGLPCCFVNEQMTSDRSNYTKIYGKGKEEEGEEGEEGEEEEVEEVEEGEEGEEGEEVEEVEEELKNKENKEKENLENKEKLDLENKENVEIFKELHTIKTDKIVSVDRYGAVPNTISELLGYNMKRKGVPRSLNSFLHCVSIAAEDKNYFAAKNKENYISALKKTIIGEIRPGLLKQELYDFSDEEIMNKLNKDFYDPLLFYRTIEETYKINIFIFSPSSDETKRLREKEESIGTMSLPRCKLFPSRSPRNDRLSVCIYRTMGSESDLLTYPQCELLVGILEESEQEIRLFKSEKLFKAFTTINKTISWELVSSDNQIDIIGRQNLYSQIDYFVLFRKLANKQYIDEYGKMRGLYLPTIKDGKSEMMVIFSPSQPENLEISSEIVRAEYADVFKLLPNPVAVSIKKYKGEDMIDGLWYSVLDLSYGIYVPIKEIKEIKGANYPAGPTNPLGENMENKVARIIKMKRDLDFLMQTIKWLYLISRLPLSVFLSKYVVNIGNFIPNIDSSLIYDFSKIGRKFPPVNEVGEAGVLQAIEEMNRRVPTMFQNKKIFLYSEKMKKGVEYLLSLYVKEHVKPDTPIPKAIQRKYLTEQDFINYNGVALFFNEKDLKIWLENLKRNYEIWNTINLSKAMISDPYIYIAPDGHIYLVQNVIEGDIKRALNVGYYWDKYHVNPGFRSPEYDEAEELKYLIWTISPANTIVPYENRAGDSLSYLSVLRYNDFAYASMIRLL